MSASAIIVFDRCQRERIEVAKVSKPIAIAQNKFLHSLLPTALFSASINIVLFVSPLYMLQVYDRVMASRSVPTLISLSILAMGLLIVYGVMEFIRSRCLSRVGSQIDEVLSRNLLAQLTNERVPLSNTRVETVVSDIDRIREFVSGTLLIALVDIPWVPLYLALCFLFDPWLGIVATMGVTLIVALALANEFFTRNPTKASTEDALKASSVMRAALRNSDVIVSMGMTRALSQKWSSTRNRSLENQTISGDRAGLFLSTTKFVRLALQSAILGVGAYLAIHDRISGGMILATSIMMGKALSPIEMAVSQWRQFIIARQSYARLRTLAPNWDDENRIELPSLKGNLSVENLNCFIPGTQTRLIKGLDFKVAAGETVAVIGSSGAGKTSLVRALLGLWPIATGSVRLDEAEIRHWEKEQLAASIGYLPQDVQLLPGTIAENISRFGGGPHGLITDAAATAGIHEMILSLPNGYETIVGEDGLQLSGGQRQRIGLARALYGAPKFIVLDEPNSNLDSAGEDALLAAVAEVKKSGSTVVVVTHRASILQLCDKVLILQEGAMQAFGATTEVMSRQSPVPQKPQHKPYTLTYSNAAGPA